MSNPAPPGAAGASLEPLEPLEPLEASPAPAAEDGAPEPAPGPDAALEPLASLLGSGQRMLAHVVSRERAGPRDTHPKCVRVRGKGRQRRH